MKILKTTILTMITFVLSINALIASSISPQKMLTPASIKAKSIFETLSHEDVLHLRIETALDSLFRPSTIYQSGTISFKAETGQPVILPIGLKVRGKSRRRHCSFPPVKLKFNKDGLRALNMNTDYNKLKLVTHCNDGNSAEQSILKEYLVYKMYNALTPNSFRVQLVAIEYVNTNQNNSSEKHYGFLIENTSEMANRIGQEEIETYNLAINQLQKDDFNLMAAFQYTIGNTDWQIEAIRNIKLVATAEDKVLAIPYDFDFSGIVKTEYAVPNVDFGLRQVEDRIFFGHFQTHEEASYVLDYLKSKKSEIFKIVKNCKKLKLNERMKMKAYLNNFYATIDEENFIQLAFINKQPVFFNKNAALSTTTAL